MRILMLAPQPFSRMRGTPLSVLQRIEGLLHLGHTVDLVTYPMGDPVYLPGLKIHRVSRLPFVRDVPIGPSFRKLAFCLPVLQRAVALLGRERFDLLHTHEEAGILGAWLSRRHRIVHLYDMHSSLPEQFANFGRFNWTAVRTLFRKLEAYTLERSDLLITVCPALDEYVGGLGFERPRAMIENSYSPSYIPPPPHATESLRARLGLQGKRVVVYTGTLESYQGLDHLVRAVPEVRAAVPDAHFLVVGGTIEQTDALRRTALLQDVADYMTFRPAVERREVAAFHQLAAVLVSCRSRGINSPLKLYEYLKSGRPIVATAIRSHLQVFDESCAELVAPTPSGIAAGLVRVLEDSLHAARLVRSAWQYSEERYSTAHYLSRLESLLDGQAPSIAPPAEPWVATPARVRAYRVIAASAEESASGEVAPTAPSSVRL
jgi:glycosyltransferase involved in cell wall biosynthesis